MIFICILYILYIFLVAYCSKMFTQLISPDIYFIFMSLTCIYASFNSNIFQNNYSLIGTLILEEASPLISLLLQPSWSSLLLPLLAFNMVDLPWAFVYFQSSYLHARFVFLSFCYHFRTIMDLVREILVFFFFRAHPTWKSSEWLLFFCLAIVGPCYAMLFLPKFIRTRSDARSILIYFNIIGSSSGFRWNLLKPSDYLLLECL